ncbi:TPA: hypothetical protein ACH3X3_010038 [Trebouxia sp. C0006]
MNNSNFILRSQCRRLPDNVLQFTPKLVKNELFIKGNAMVETAVPGHIQRLSQGPIAHMNPRVWSTVSKLEPNTCPFSPDNRFFPIILMNFKVSKLRHVGITQSTVHTACNCQSNPGDSLACPAATNADGVTLNLSRNVAAIKHPPAMPDTLKASCSGQAVFFSSMCSEKVQSVLYWNGPPPEMKRDQ